MDQFIQTMKALSDKNRIFIIKMLLKKKMCVCEVETALNVSQSTASKHLKVLENSGLVEREKDGLWVNYKIRKAHENEWSQQLIHQLETQFNDSHEVQTLLSDLKSIDRVEICSKKV